MTILIVQLVAAYKQVTIGDPLQPGVLMGPLIDRAAVDAYRIALDEVKKDGGEILYGGHVLDRAGNFVEPTIVRVKRQGTGCAAGNVWPDSLCVDL